MCGLLPKNQSKRGIGTNLEELGQIGVRKNNALNVSFDLYTKRNKNKNGRYYAEL